MGNSSSRPNTPGANNSPQNGSPNSAPKRKPPKRKESIGGLTNKGVAAAPTASLESALGRSSQPSAQGDASSSRGRAQTLPTHSKNEHVNLDGKSTASSISASRSKSPRPPLNVDTSSAGPSELEPVTRSVSSNQSITSDSPTPFYGPHSQFGRAPRLPLPIEEEVLSPGSPAPGSPVLGPTDSEDKAEYKDVPRTRSVTSAITIDEDDDVDDDEIYRADEVKGPLVDTLIEWKEGGDKVYVTGTFCAWAKKSRLHRNGPSKDPNAFSVIIGLPPGTIYLAFLVDGIAMTARHMPTTVDFANSLVNYLLVPYQSTAQPVILNDAHRTTHQDKKLDHTTSPPAPETRPATASETQAAPPTRTPSRRQAQPAPTSAQSESKPMRKKTKPDDKDYHTEIPDYLLHWDEHEQSSKVRRSNAISSTHQPPPQLPPYLQKSILSAVTALKDDASVLVMPNHTVINHLATSSIKDNVLGTSATTRYKKKFVTTIMYMPTSASGS